MSEPPVWVSFTDRLAAALEEAAADKSAAGRLDELRDLKLSAMITVIGGAEVKAKHEAKASDEYRALTEELCAARTKANLSAAKAKGMEHKLDAWRTAESSRRTEMGLK